MPDPIAAIAATFIEPRGMIRSIVSSAAGREIAGAAGAAAAAIAASSLTPDASPLGKGQIRYFVDAPGRI